jgi:murein DD-endopeptidase MepM/ murein hydrolase activator NlpD
MKPWLLVLLLSLGYTVLAEDQIYRVKRGDTLSSIARQYGVSAAQIADRNELTRAMRIDVGQRLIIPDNSPETSKLPQPAKVTKNPPSALPNSAQKTLDKARVTPGRWKYIVIHHSGVDTGNLKSIDRYHREQRHMEHGLAYHFLIGNGSGMGDGEIAIGQRWKDQLDGGHLASEAQNKIALGICLIGNFEEHGPSEKQLRSLDNLIRALMVRCGLTPSSVKTHQQINVIGTRCPGSHFPAKSFLQSLQKTRQAPPRR